MLFTESLKTYISKFQRLKQGNTEYGKAPHKPVLLLAVINQIEKGQITDNRLTLY
jgi:putative restriction endonuclease